MIFNISPKDYYKCFKEIQNPFLQEKFIELNSYKVDNILYLVNNAERPAIGIILGAKGGILLSPFSAPFGGFNYTHENIYIGEIEKFIEDLKDYFSLNKYFSINIVLPPSIYGNSFNAKAVNVLIRTGFNLKATDITNFVDLNRFEEKFQQRNSREYYNQAVRNKLTFVILQNADDKKYAYDLISDNRKKFGRPIYMSFEDIIRTSEIWHVEFFGVFTIDGGMVASGIFYRFHKKIVYATFWGDNEEGRKFRAMDFLSFNLWSHYKKSGYSFVDLGISTEQEGIPNEGLLRFKESHEAISEIKFKLFL